MNNIIRKKITLILKVLATGLLILQACKSYDNFRNNYDNSSQLLNDTRNLPKKPYLKAHLKNGDVCILKNSWEIDSTQTLLTGKGVLYDLNRAKKLEGNLSIFIDSVAIFETNTKLDSTETGRIAALAILAGLDVILGIICVTVPKACFGSCPTFYLNEKDDIHYADAEGFSNAILPSLEYHDIDALSNQPVTGRNFSITMKNEALETHCIKNLRLLVYPREKGQRVYQSPVDNFYLCENSYKVRQAYGPEGDITNLVDFIDRQERFSYADRHNLSSREEVYLDFVNVEKKDDLGLIINFRQSLMTTYLIYNAMGYMGKKVGEIYAKIETDDQIKKKLNNGIKKELGDIDIYSWNEQTGHWDFKGGFYETGPIALNCQILPLENVGTGSDVKLKLILNKGLWRIDYIALTNIKCRVEPVEIFPDAVLNKGKEDVHALEQINNSEKYLISMPGSEYKFQFKLPEESRDYELFLYSKGYYLEWMREHWKKDKNLWRLKLMIEKPQRYLKVEARSYKRYEAMMEQIFWNSKVDTKSFSYHEY
jgi:hypothetical protein